MKNKCSKVPLSLPSVIGDQTDCNRMEKVVK